MYPSKFFFIMISVLAHFSLSIRQAQAQCPTAKVDQNDCVIASRMIQFGTDDSIVKGESKIVVRYGGCLLSTESIPNSGAALRKDVFKATNDVFFGTCTKSLPWSIDAPAARPNATFVLTVDQPKPNDIFFGNNKVTLDKVTCGTSKLPSAINLQDCISSIPKFFGTQSNVEIRITTKTCSVYLKSSNRMFLPDDQNYYWDMINSIGQQCKTNAGSMIKKSSPNVLWKNAMVYLETSAPGGAATTKRAPRKNRI
ncbi:hypothetical protein PGT21_035111 [Puccinia graminis f. sp. tritici]|uniref:Uncharacterized protein n=1 Tax=Puccinia graminis f. sp. tritici TaxID=56615 RepID=A0A5B0R499_PUCGR|nr:hypothetical protein PGT21_035111 [Puccinia graminis f. sp. tritici]